MVSGTPIPESTCNPMDANMRQQFQLEFLAYLRRVQASMRPSLRDSLISTVTDDPNRLMVYQGYMLFSIPPLLKILPSDFGQNEITPYGVMSFFPTYLLNCLLFSSDAEENEDVSQSICNLLFPNASPVIDTLCRTYVDTITEQLGLWCPFDVNTQNPSLDIQDPQFFHLVGTLGSFSINDRQGTIMYVDLPVADLHLDYWSFTLYLGDRLKRDETCTPYRQTYLASMASPLSAYNVPSIAGKRFNAINGTGDVKETGHVRGYIILALNECIANYLVNIARQRDDGDFVYWMQIPSTMTIDPSLPNPNQLTSTDLLYNPETDRLSLFLRLSPSKDATNEQKQLLKQFVNYETPFLQSSVDLCFVEFRDDMLASLSNSCEEWSTSKPFTIEPLPISTLVHEPITLANDWTRLQRTLSQSLYRENYSSRRLATRNTLLNVFSPFTPSILNTTTVPYRGGWQAIQMAGCAQGDNPDAIYRLSEGVCLSMQDVMYGIFVNHAYYGNCIYNNVNVLDLNKAYSFASVSLNRSTDVAYYIVIVSRNADRLTNVERLLRQRCSEASLSKIGFYPIFIETGPTVNEKVPMCHQVMMVERIYVNTLYPSLEDPTRAYSLYDTFGEDLASMESMDDDDRWRSLVNVTAPDVTDLIAPSYVRLTYPSNRRQIFTVSLGILAIVVGYGTWRIAQQVWTKSKSKPHKSS